MNDKQRQITVRFGNNDLAEIRKFVEGGYGLNAADYIRRAVREQISRDRAEVPA